MIITMCVFLILNFGRNPAFSLFQDLQTNKAVLKSLVHEILAESTGQVLDYDSYSIKKGTTESDLFFEDSILEFLKTRNKKVFYIESISDKNEGVFLGYENVNFEITYEIFGKNSYLRNVFLQMNIKLIDLSTKEVLYFNPYKKNFSDQLSKTDMEYLIDMENSLLKGTLKGKSRFKKLLEPVLAVAGSIIIVYLFFSIRSR